MSDNNILVQALETRSSKLRKEWDRTRRKYSEDGVHNLRVASRRLIAVLELLEVGRDQDIRDCRRRLKKLLDELSPLRDLHVQRVHVSTLAQRHPQLKSFEKTLADKENRTAQRVQKLLKQSPKLERSIGRISRHVKKSAGNDSIFAVIDNRYRKVLELAAGVQSSDSETIHSMRLAFKKFRYTCEVAQPIIKKYVDKERLKQFHAFQTMMGDVQDVEVLSARLLKWAKKNDRETEMEPVLEELRNEREKRIVVFMASLDQVHSFWNPGVKK
jgi:CHAD domain-containing protein